MERRDFLKFAFGVAAGAGAIAAAATAASAAPMLSHHNLTGRNEPDVSAEPALADQDDLARAAEPEKVYWRRRYYRRRYWRRRRW